jgi:hypothetical protein
MPGGWVPEHIKKGSDESTMDRHTRFSLTYTHIVKPGRGEQRLVVSWVAASTNGGATTTMEMELAMHNNIESIQARVILANPCRSSFTHLPKGGGASM